MLGLLSAMAFIYGVYLLLTEEETSSSTEDKVVISVSEEQESDSSDSEEIQLARSQSEPNLNNLWDSYRLEEKYNEIQEKIPFLDQSEFKQKVRNQVMEILNDPDWKNDYQTYLDEKRGSRPPGTYAVIADTALNLAEYYEIRHQQSLKNSI